MRNSFLFLCCLLFTSLTLAQTVRYAYDPAGNRISRTIVLNTLRSAPQNETEEEEEEEKEASPTFVEQLTDDLQVKIYPNPTKGLLQIEIAGNENDNNTPIAVFNQSGQQILATQTAGQITPVDLSGVPAGTYILRLIIRERTENYTIIKK